ncbi:diacylglycerol kinase family lipid kinase [Verrucomicrobia bacterium]|nr:diacylglycerol kinase family lipid kinase [Verrucomicrobiota bacterium]MDG1890899.1 diacylglycerol kinase family lipid kinase [Verrucomicrobiota bacterium]
MIHKLHLLTNPAGGVGNNLALEQQATSYLKRRGVEVTAYHTQFPGHAEELVRTIPLNSNDCVCGIGGDGTMHEIINGMMQRPENRRVPVSLIPGGTGNSFMEDAQLLDVSKALEVILKNQRKRIDLLEVRLDQNLRYAFNVCGWGLFATGNELAESMRWLGRLRYDAAGLLKILKNDSHEARLEMDESTIEDHFSLIVASNSRYVGKGMLLSPEARYDDGLLDLLYLRKTSRLALARLFMSLHKGEHVNQPGVSYVQTRAFRIQAMALFKWNLDGEATTGKEARVQALKSAIEWIL